MGTIPMTKNSEIGTAQPAAIDQAGMAKSICQNETFFPDHGRDDSQVRQIAGPEHERRLSLLEGGKSSFQVHMGRKSSTYQARRAGSRPKFFGCMDCSLNDIGMRREPQVVVGTEKNNPPS